MRVFVGIKVTDEITRACVKLQSGIADLPARFIPPKDIHLTLLPPWETDDRFFVEEKLRQTIRHAKRFALKFERFAYGPDDARPRLAWLVCASSAELIALKKELCEAFEAKDRVPFTPHATIARFSKKDAEKLARRRIEKPLDLSMVVSSIELFESPHQGGTGYAALASLPLP